MRAIEIPVGAGELIDKITILEIKLACFEASGAAAKSANTAAELALLRRRRDDALPDDPALAALALRLKQVNRRIWDLEEEIRRLAAAADFGPAFTAVAREIPRANDVRAALKRQVSEHAGSSLLEEKSHFG